jgi:competence protein ComEA
MSADRQDNSSSGSVWLIRRMDQAAVAGLVIVALVAMVAWWIAKGGIRGRLIEIERAPPRTAVFLVDINQAEWPELAQLPGIGETLARRIVESRQADGPFLKHDDLQRVQGIGPKTLDAVRGHLLPMPGENLVHH